jgi:hypothetical protein
MSAKDTVHGLAGFERRAAGSDAERRASLWLRNELRSRRRDAVIEPFWCRPNWALAHAWHVALGLAGSLTAVGSPRIGGVLILAALLSVISDVTLGISPGRRLTPEHASQNVVSPPPSRPTGDPARVRLILTANYDAPRTGLAYRDRPRAAAATLRRITAGVTPGWLGWIAIALLWLEAVAIIRIGGTSGNGVGLLQLFPTVGLVLELAALIDIGSADFSPGAGDNASGVAVTIALARALDAAPPRHAEVEVVLQGASDGSGAGLRTYLRRRRRELGRTNTVVIGFAATAAGELSWWTSDGPLWPLRYFGRLRRILEEIAARDPEPRLRPHAGRGSTPALPARMRRLPAITLGALDARGVEPRSHQPGDTPEHVDPDLLAHAVEAGLLLVDAIDSTLAERASGASEAQSSPRVAA